MKAEEQIKRITKLLNDISLDTITRTEFEEEFPKQSINEIKDEMWQLYCFASDIRDTLIM